MTSPSDPEGQTPLAVWLAEVQRELRGADFERTLTTLTREGLRVQPLYTEAPSGGSEAPRAAALARLRAGRTWARVLSMSCAGGPEGLAARAQEEQEGGADGLHLLSADLPDTSAGWDALWEAVKGPGPFWMSAGADALPWAALLGSKAPGPVFVGADPLGALAAAGQIPLHLDQSLDELAELLRARAALPAGSRVLGIDLSPWHGAGADLALCLGFGLSNALWLLRGLEQRGLSARDLAEQWVFTLPMGRDLFTNLAALRALRGLWARIMVVMGVKDAPPLWLHAVTSPALLSRRDPAVNALRGTLGAVAAILGGADSVTVAPMDLARGLPSERGTRLARNTSLVLLHEAQLGEVLDPAGGAYAIESLTDGLARKAWEQVQRIEKAGGAAHALLDGTLLSWVTQAREAWLEALERRKEPTTGVSETADPNEPPAPRAQAAPAIAHKVGAAEPLPEQGLFSALRVRAAQGASLAQLDRDLGRGPIMRVTALAPLSDSAPFEELRDRVDAHRLRAGAWPTVFLATLGPAPEWRARAAWTRNLLQAAGLQVLEDEQGAPVDDCAAVARQRFLSSGAEAACLCGADARYPELAVPVALALHEAGARPVWMAGRPGALEASLRDAHVTGFAFLGQNAARTLSELLDHMGVAR